MGNPENTALKMYGDSPQQPEEGGERQVSSAMALDMDEKVPSAENTSITVATVRGRQQPAVSSVEAESLAQVSEETNSTRRIKRQRTSEQASTHEEEEMKSFPAKALQSLRGYYREHYATIPSCFSDHKVWPISNSCTQLAAIARADIDVSGEDQIQDRLPQSYESIRALKRDIKLERLFEAQKLSDGVRVVPKKIFLVGRAGIGKTTLCHKLAYLWSIGKWYNDKFEAVYILPVRNLKQKKYNGANLKSQRNLETAIAQECYNGASLSDRAFKQLTEHINEQLARRSAKVLIVLDGLDERSGACEEIISQAKNRGKETSRLWVSRPYGAEEAQRVVEEDKETLLVEHVGLNTKQIEAYIKTYFKDEKQSQGLQEFLPKQTAMRGTTHVPINLQILCALWADTKDEKAFQQATSGSIAGLYDALCNCVWKRCEACGVTFPKNEEKEVLYQALGKVALAGLHKGALLIGQQVVDEAIAQSDYKEEALRTLLKDSGFLRETESQEHYFLHLTFQEYFAGKELARQFLSLDEEEQKAAVTFLHKNQFKSHYQMTLLFMAGELGKRQGAKGAARLLEALQGSPEEEMVGFQRLLLQLRCFNELVRSVDAPMAQLESQYDLTKQLVAWARQGLKYIRKNLHDMSLHRAVVSNLSYMQPLLVDVAQVYVQAVGDEYVCEAGVNALAELTKVSHTLFPEVLEAFLKAARNKSEDIRFAATSALGELAKAAPTLTTLETFVKAARDGDKHVRSAIISALGELAKASPTLAPKVLETLVQATRDNHKNVRSEAAHVLSKVVKVVPKKFYKTIQEALFVAVEDKDAAVRSSAASTLGELVKAAPHLAPKVLETLLKAASDTFPWVRGDATIALAKLTKADPTLASNALKALLKAVQDDDKDVRGEVVRTFAGLSKVAPDLAPKALEVLLKAVRDDKTDVRSIAISGLRELVEATPTLAPKAVEALLEDVKDDNKTICSVAISALGELVKAAPALAPEVLVALIEGLRADNEDVCSAASHALVRLIKVVPTLTTLEVLVKVAQDDYSYVRSAAVVALGEFAEAMPTLAPKILEALLEAVGDDHWNVCHFATSALLKLANVDSSLDSKMLYETSLEALLKAMRNNAWHARYAAAQMLSKLAKVDPTFSPEILDALLKAAGDEKSWVRIAAASALGEIARTDSKQVPKVLSTLFEATRDDDTRVCEAAVSALGELIKVAPTPATLEVLVQTTMAKYHSVCSAAKRALTGGTTKVFIKTYCQSAATRKYLPPQSIWNIIDAYCDETPLHDLLLPHIMNKLYTQVLTVSPGEDAQHYHLRPYQNSRKAIEWEAPHWEIDQLKEAIKKQCPLGEASEGGQVE
ncbi:MAG: sister chromatid cohesion protein PDS5 [Bacteroidota bacterium]